ncbi:MAG: hypothetical protein ACOX60_11620 [Massiliimalia sp.]|jgi:Cu+-exporting ATPase
MPRDGSNIDDILDQLTTELSEVEDERYEEKLKKYDTNILLKQVYGNLENQTPQSEVDPQKSESSVTVSTPGEPAEAEDAHTPAAPLGASPYAVPAPGGPGSVPPKAEQDGETVPAPQQPESPVPVDEDAEKKQALHNTHLKYMTLKKNREKAVQNFTLKTELNSPKVEVIPDQVMSAGKMEPDPEPEPEETQKPLSEGMESTQEIPNEPAAEAAAPSQADQPEMDAQQEKGQEATRVIQQGPIKAYVPGETPTDEVPVVEENPVPEEMQELSSRYIREWKKNLQEEMVESADTRLSEYNVPGQTDLAQRCIHELKRSLKIKGILLLALLAVTGLITFLNTREVENPVIWLDPLRSPFSYCCINLVLTIGAGVVCFDMIRDGLLRLIHKKPGRYSLYSIGFAMMVIFQAVLLISPESVNSAYVQVYTPLLFVVLLLAICGKLMAMERIQRNFQFVSGDGEKYSVTVMDNQVMAEDFVRGNGEEDPCLVYNKKTPFLSQFFTESFSEDLTDYIAKYTVPVVCGVGLLVAVIALVMGYDMFMAFTALTGILLAGAGSVNLFVVNYPLLRCSKLISRMGGAVLGYNAVDNCSDINAALINAGDLFPAKNVVLYSINTFTNIAHVIQDTASVLCETKSILSDVFLNICNQKKEYLDPVDTVIYEDGMGISAWLGNRRVLIGSREMMINHNVRVPSERFEQKYREQNKNLVYFSTEGELGAVFVFGITADEEIRDMLVDVYNNNAVCVIKTVDPFLTAAELGRVFRMPENSFRVIPSRLYKETKEMSQTKESANGAVSNNGTLPAYLYSFLYAKRLGKPIRLGMLVNFVSIGVALLLFAAFTLLASIDQLTNFVLCVYEIAALLVSLLVQKCYRLSE